MAQKLPDPGTPSIKAPRAWGSTSPAQSTSAEPPQAVDGVGGPLRGQRAKRAWGSTFTAVAWSFFGVRRGKDHEADMARLNPVHVIVAGVLMAALFVVTLLTIVRYVVG